MSILSRSLKIDVYTGLTLEEEEVLSILPSATVRAPVKQFDVLASIRDGYHVVIIIDGVFHQAPAVSPCEIMDALRRGLLVYGCSSMGALRAAELYPYGMRGVGEIYEWIKHSPAFRDDFAGVAFTREDGRFRTLSIPHVDFVFGLRRLRESGAVSEADAELLTRCFADIYYPERTLGALRSVLSRLGRTDLHDVARRVCREGVSQKRLDALATLRQVRVDLEHIRNLNLRLSAQRLGVPTRKNAGGCGESAACSTRPNAPRL